MGQTKPTEVYCYYAEDTVEKNILDLAARTGLSIYTKDNASKTVNVTDLDKVGEGTKKNMDAPGAKKNQKGDFIFKVDDMLAILFPHMYEDMEFLLPEEAISLEMAVDDTQDQVAPVFPPGGDVLISGRWTGGDNAAAGPSHRQ
jgi:E3 ubiquitin-protein ligase SHPRH